MSSDAWPLLIYFLLLFLVAVVIESLVIAFVINLITGSPLHARLLSSTLVGIIAFFAAFAFMIFVPGQFTSYNGEPTSLKAWLVHNQLALYAVSVLAFITIWQVFARQRLLKGKK